MLESPWTGSIMASETQNTSYGSTGPENNVPGETNPPKISGKGWGRVKKFVTGQSEFPGSVFFIVGTEFCERFSYYGMRAILVLYFTNILLLNSNTATALYHTFIMLCYFTPLFGAMIADGLLGKYRTILYISLIYVVGNIVMCLTALPPQTTSGTPELMGPMVGLILIGLGTGGIKPCVSAFGGDQFGPDQKRSLQMFFSVFYFSINLGSVISTFITPILRHDVQCFGNDCYALAFGVPALLLFFAVCTFFAGRSMYKIYPSRGNIVYMVLAASGYAIKSRICSDKSAVKRAHWLDWADDKYDEKLLQDTKDLYHVLKMYILFPIFWALFDQQGSRWTLQAEHMDGRLGNIYTFKPDQMQFLNPVLILIMIPLFEAVIYPIMEKLKIPTRPLARMGAGMLLGAIAFLLAAMVQYNIESSEVMHPGAEQAIFKIINTSPCPINAEFSNFYDGSIDYATGSEQMLVPVGSYDVNFSPECPELPGDKHSIKVVLNGQKVSSVIVFERNGHLSAIEVEGEIQKAIKGRARVSLGIFTKELEGMSNITLHLESDSHTYMLNSAAFSVSGFADIDPDMYDVLIEDNQAVGNDSLRKIGIFEAEPGAIYRLMLQPSNDTSSDEIVLKTYTDVEPNNISMFLQIPQYVIITAGEILFSITGLEFSYSQAPASMKSCVQAAWLLTVAFGNLIIVIIAKSAFFESQAAEFLLFACLTGVIFILFSIMACFYEYITPSQYTESELLDASRLIPVVDYDKEEEEGEGQKPEATSPPVDFSEPYQASN